jgi:hypothetical protein
VRTFLTLLILLSGCASANQSLDEANEASKEIGKPVGKAMNIPTSVMRGGAEGIKSKENDPNNPFGR